MTERAVSPASPIDAPWRLVALGAMLGTTWAASLRGLMSTIAGVSSTVEWSGTFVQILAPAAVVGGLYGWAEHLRRFDGPPWRRWFALAPLLFGLAGLTGVATWSDAGAAAVMGLALTVIAAVGGVALSGTGPLWSRLLGGLLAIVPVVVFVTVLPGAAGPAFALARPRGAWLTVYFAALLTVYCLAGSIPFRRAPRGRRVTGRAGPSARLPAEASADR
ncbi:hypothetical protein [Agromyces badenianii]|nr:hypothetical protein [Agromyces badenianii]